MNAATNEKFSSVQETEQFLIELARTSLSFCDWRVGEAAAKWHQRYARGRTDADFGALIGLNGESVAQRRRVFERFAEFQDSYLCLKFSHYREALTWEDAETCLEWANENLATVAEMKAWRRMQNGDDLTVPDDSEETSATLAEFEAEQADGSEVVPAMTEPDRDPRETQQTAAAASSAYAPFRNEAMEKPQREKSANDIDDAKRFRRCLSRLGTAAREAFEIRGGLFGHVLRDHLDQLAEDVRQGESPTGLDKQTIGDCIDNAQREA